MSNKQTKPLVPKLRFPEFLTAEGWNVVPLSQLATRTKKKNRDQKITRVLTNSAEFGVVDQRDFFDKEIATQGNLESYFIVEIGSYVYNPRISTTAPVGPISKNKIGTGVMSPLYTVFKFENDSNEFYEYYFKTNGWHAYMRQASSTGARHDRMAISNDDFMAMPLPMSSPAEQQKIADCLSSLDELIAAQARKVDALKTHKKGLMQQLFPREGETQPRLRFPEFRDAGEWDADGLGVVADFVNEKVALERVALENYVSTENILADYGGIDRASRLPTTGSVTRFQSNDTLVSNIRPYLKKVWVADKEGGASNDVIVIRAKQRLLPQYLSALLKNDAFIDYVMTGAKGVKMPRGDVGSMKAYPALYPSKPEQQKIADCLSSLDELIAAQARKVDALKTHKKGLMQQLFPLVEDIEV